MRTMRPRLCALREAAGAVFLAKPSTTSSASTSLWGHKKSTLTLRRTPLQSPFNTAGPHFYDISALHCHCNRILPISPSYHFPLFCKRSFSTGLGRKASSKSSSFTKLRTHGPGKTRKQGGTSRRTVTVSASSKLHVASFGERKTRQVKAGAAKGSARTAMASRERPDSRSKNRSGSVNLHSQSRTQTKDCPSDSRSNNGSGSVNMQSQTRTFSKDSPLDSRSNNRPGSTNMQSQSRTQTKEEGAVGLTRKSSLMSQKARRSEEARVNSVKSKGSTQNKGPQKKGKRVMRLDPQDTTSKRLYEGYPLPGEEVQESMPAALSGRVQFRQIVPQSKLLEHIERHLLGRRRPSELQRAGYDMKITPAPLDNIPYSKKGERQPIQEEVFRHKLRFAAAAKSESSLPPYDIPEVAFAGRSNVGKSSLINALTRQWGVARTSDKPGLTQTINFFRLGGRLCLVDLPGYGFAYAAEEKKEAWEEFVKEFLTTRAGLKRVYVLVDAKWGLKLKDEELIEYMEKAGTKYQIVLTKSDTVTPMDLARRATQIQEIFKDNKFLMLPMVMVSSKTGEGLEFFRRNVAKLAKASLI